MLVPTREFSESLKLYSDLRNFQCSNVGALAELFDASCLYNTPLFASLTDIAIAAWSRAPPAVTTSELIKTLHIFPTSAILGKLNLTFKDIQLTHQNLLGQHYYVTNPLTGQGINPKWDFTSQGADAGKSDAFVVAAKVNGASAPTGSQDIDWVQLGNIGSGALAQQVYRTDTRLGQPPASVRSFLDCF